MTRTWPSSGRCCAACCQTSSADRRMTKRARPDPPHPPHSTKTVEIHPHGLRLCDPGEIVPLWAGAMHYWRHAPEDWSSCLDAMKAMGLRLVDIYVPWGVHEVAQGTFDFGQHYARLDVARFVELCGQ